MTLEQHIMNEAVSYAQEILRLKDERAELLATTAKLREALAAAAADTARLDAMEELVNNGCCPGIINDDAGRWAVTGDGMQNLPCNDNAIDINTTFFVEAGKWRDSIREAIDDYLKDDDDEDEDDAALSSTAP